MIYLEIEDIGDGVEVDAYCQTIVDRLYLFGLLKTVFDRQLAIKKRTELTAYPTKLPLGFELIGPRAVELLISHLRDHEIVFCVRATGGEVKFKNSIGPIHRLSPQVLTKGSEFLFDYSASRKALLRLESESMQDPDNWIWQNLPAALKQTA